MMSNILYYVHDPMCSWCWGFAPVWQQIQAQLPPETRVQYVLGGLAEDTDEPMPVPLQHYLQQTWQMISDQLGTEFNFDFWSQCQPRRSTYPACRAVIAAQAQGAEKAMITAIQQAYYLKALNPSDDKILIQLATEIGLDTPRFTQDLRNPVTQQALTRQVALSQTLGAQGLPSLIYQTASGRHLLRHDYVDPVKTLSAITAITAS